MRQGTQHGLCGEQASGIWRCWTLGELFHEIVGDFDKDHGSIQFLPAKHAFAKRLPGPLAEIGIDRFDTLLKHIATDMRGVLEQHSSKPGAAMNSHGSYGWKMLQRAELFRISSHIKLVFRLTKGYFADWRTKKSCSAPGMSGCSRDHRCFRQQGEGRT
jgi:hypothetical protein